MISLLKPNIDPEGNFYPCCGIQYSQNDEIRNFDQTFSMGNVFEEGILEEIYENQEYFDGSVCKKCYYSDYNNTLNDIWDFKSLKHKAFI